MHYDLFYKILRKNLGHIWSDPSMWPLLTETPWSVEEVEIQRSGGHEYRTKKLELPFTYVIASAYVVLNLLCLQFASISEVLWNEAYFRSLC